MKARQRQAEAAWLRKAFADVRREVRQLPEWEREIYARNRKTEEQIRKERAR